jgi:hypothetical protein
MTDPVQDAARAAGRQLSRQYGSNLTDEIETALQERDFAAVPGQYPDPVSLGSLIVSIATLAWTVYSNLRTKHSDPTSDTVIHAVRVQLNEKHSLDTTQHQEIITITVQETLKSARMQTQDPSKSA